MDTFQPRLEVVAHAEGASDLKADRSRSVREQLGRVRRSRPAES